MKKTVLTFGALSGGLAALLMFRLHSSRLALLNRNRYHLLRNKGPVIWHF